MIHRKYKKAILSKGRTVSWFTSFILHGLILIILLASSSQIRSKISEQPAKIINKFQTSNLLEESKVEELTGIQMNSGTVTHQALNISSKANFDAKRIITAKKSRLSPKKIGIKSTKNNISSFFGTSGEGERICYMVDISGSMIMAIEYIKKELANSISKLEPNQYFQIIFYAGTEPIVFSPNNLVRASFYDREKAISFINNIDVQAVPPGLEGWRSVAAALHSGFDSQTTDAKYANLFYLFTDGNFDINIISSILDNLQQRKSTPAIVNILQCGSKTNDIFLNGLARKNQGEYKYLTDEELVKPPASRNVPDYLNNVYTK